MALSSIRQRRNGHPRCYDWLMSQHMRLSFDYFSVAAGVADHVAFTVDQDLVKYDFKQSASKRQDFADFLADPAPSRKKARVVLEETNQTDELEVWLQELLDESDMALWRGMIETEAVLAAAEAETQRL